MKNNQNNNNQNNQNQNGQNEKDCNRNCGKNNDHSYQHGGNND